MCVGEFRLEQLSIQEREFIRRIQHAQHVDIASRDNERLDEIRAKIAAHPDNTARSALKETHGGAHAKCRLV
jgi:organic hydroperoxide reductase OsmC/OhrA